MARLRYSRHPLEPRHAHELLELEAGAPLMPQLCRRWPDGPPRPFTLYRGSIAPGAAVGPELAARLVVARHDVFILQGYPAGPVLPFIPLIVSVISVAAAFIFKPDEPELPVVEDRAEFDRTQPGPNTKITSRANEIRLGGRIPEIYGRRRVWPDVITPGYTEFVGNEQYLTEWLCIGIGLYELEDARVGDTGLSGLAGSTARVYEAGAVPDDVLEVRANGEVRSIELVNPDDARDSLIGDFDAADGAFESDDPILYYAVDDGYLVNFAATASNDGTYLVESKQEIHPTPGATRYVVRFYEPGFTDETDVNATFRVASTAETVTRQCQFSPGSGGNNRPDGIRLLDYDPGPDPWLETLSVGLGLGVNDPTDTYTGVYTIDSWEQQHNQRGNSVYVSDESGPATFTPGTVDGVLLTTIDVQAAANVTGWYELPINDPAEIWLDFEFPRGLYTEVAGSGRSNYTVEIEYEIRAIGDPLVATGSVSYTEREIGPLRYTHKIATGEIGLTGTRYEVRCRKVTQPPSDTGSQVWVADVDWTQAAGVRDLPPMELGDVTTIVLKSRATILAAAIQARRFNAIATRRLPQWTPGGGGTWSEPVATRRMADAFAHRAKAEDGGRYTDADLDLAGIYAVQAELDAIDGGEAGHFDFSFDAVGSTDNELVQIADACRCTAYRTGSRLFIRRREASPAPVAMFNRRNKAPDGEVKLMSFQQPTSADGVRLEWVDSGSREFVTRTLTVPDGATSPRRVKLAGATNWSTVWRRAWHEWQRLRLSRDRITVNVTDEGRLVTTGDNVANVDNIDLDELDGEIVAYDAPTRAITLERDVYLEAGVGSSITIRDPTGRAVDTVSITATADPRVFTLARDPTVEIYTGDAEVRNLWTIGTDDTAGALLYTVVDSTPGEQYTTLELEAYDPALYEYDAATVPPQST